MVTIVKKVPIYLGEETVVGCIPTTTNQLLTVWQEGSAGIFAKKVTVFSYKWSLIIHFCDFISPVPETPLFGTYFGILHKILSNLKRRVTIFVDLPIGIMGILILNCTLGRWIKASGPLCFVIVGNTGHIGIG